MTSTSERNEKWIMGVLGNKNIDVHNRVKIRVTEDQKQRAVDGVKSIIKKFKVPIDDAFEHSPLSNGTKQVGASYIGHRENLRRFCILIGE